MEEVQNKKFDEGVQHIKTAEKSLKTSFLKWKPDHDTAADEYSKAAGCFKTCKSYSQCRDAYRKAANYYKQAGSLFQAAKCLEQVILVSKEMGDFHEIANLAEDASNMFQINGSADTAALLLEKAAKILQDHSSVDALRLYQHAADVAMSQDNIKQAAEYTSKAARIFVKLQCYDEAVAALRREISLHEQADDSNAIGRLAVALVLLHLARRDYVAAEKAFKEWGGFCEQPEVQTLEELLQAYDEEDPEGVTKALNSPFIKNMDISYARLAAELPLPKGIATIPPPASIRHNAAPSYVSPHADKGDESESAGSGSKTPDEFEGGLR